MNNLHVNKVATSEAALVTAEGPLVSSSSKDSWVQWRQEGLMMDATMSPEGWGLDSIGCTALWKMAWTTPYL